MLGVVINRAPSEGCDAASLASKSTLKDNRAFLMSEGVFVRRRCTRVFHDAMPAERTHFIRTAAIRWPPSVHPMPVATYCVLCSGQRPCLPCLLL